MDVVGLSALLIVLGAILIEFGSPARADSDRLEAAAISAKIRRRRNDLWLTAVSVGLIAAGLGIQAVALLWPSLLALD